MQKIAENAKSWGISSHTVPTFSNVALRWRTPNLGVSVNKGASDTGEVRQLRREASSDKSGVSGEDGGDE